ncbi:uncharacterized protein SPSK_09678 [Sporothrix schenckii 1099-18]|uniref:Uncharacterized protein n=1 Tax=Sporothrix schenckii 1099-18 TaxID=1397361 RepID=A0A0F2M9S0_SPOSC|nr:uncharacterized protein SPSK_09678 [Sporothrix schenckii 1099-18]KJR84911.1 hypothetical protein SPSK_09678 [Sporothrix schenckii 1099-18]
MATKTSLAPIAKAGLSERELLMVAAAFSSLKNGDIAIDWDKFTLLAGYGSTNSARVCFRPLQKKLKAFVGSSELGEALTSSKASTAKVDEKKPAAPSAPTRGRPKKRKLEDQEGNGCKLPSLTVKQEASDDQGKEELPHGAAATTPPKTPGQQCQRIKLEEMLHDRAAELGGQVAAPEQPLARLGNLASMDVLPAVGGFQAAEGSRDYQEFFCSCDEEKDLDFGEYVHKSDQGERCVSLMAVNNTFRV